MATSLFVNSDWSGCSAGDPVFIDDEMYTFGTDAFADIQSAVNAASTTEATTIKVYDGTYDEDITFRASVLGEQKGDISIVAVGDNAVVTGTFAIGYYKSGGSTEAWTSDLSFEGLKFESYVTETGASLFIEDTSGKLSVSDCEFTGKIDGAWLTGYPSGAIVGDHIFSNCVFQDGYVHSGGQKSTTFDNCTMTECSCNFTRGNSVVLNDCTITKTLTDADGGDSFYVIRADGGVPVTINGGSFIIDSTASAGTVPGAKGWAVLWQKSGTAKWTVSDVMVNYTDAAADNSNLKFENDISTDVNRVTIDDITYKVNGTEASIDELLAGSSGYVCVVNADGAKTLYDDGDVAATSNNVFVNASWTSASELPEGAVWGFNAFSSFTNAYNAVAADGSIKVSGDAAVDGAALTDLDKAVTIGGAGEITLGTAAVSAAIAISDVKLTATSLTNSGTITASGTANFNIVTLTGNGISFADGVTVKDSFIGGELQNIILGKVTFDGDSTISGLTPEAYGTKIVVGAGDSLTVTDARLAFGYDMTFSVTGEIENALTADKTEVKLSLDYQPGLSITGGGSSTFSVTDAYVKIFNTSSKNSGASGKFELTFTNSIVDFTNQYQLTTPSGTLNPEFITTFDGSVVTFAGNLKIDHTNSNIVLKNGTVLTASLSFKNNGDFQVLSGSRMTVNGYSGMAEHAGQYNKLTVSGEGSYFTITNTKTAVPWQNSGSVFITDKGQVNVDYITNTGAITIDASSLLTGATLTNNGTITINAADLAANTAKKVIDLNQSAALTGVTLNDPSGTASLFYGDDGDVWVTNVSVADIYVNAEWAGYSVGQAIDLGSGTTVYYGIDAFSRMEDVTDKIATDGSDTTVHILSNLTPAASLNFSYGNGKVSFVKDGDESVSVAFANIGDFLFVQGTEATITIGEGVTFSTYDNKSDFAVYYGPSLSVYGTISGGANFGALYVSDGDHKVHTTGTIGTGRIHMWDANLTIYGIEGEGADLKRRYDADVAVADRSTDAQAHVNFLFLSSGTFTASDTYITVGNLTTGGDGHGIYDTNQGKVQSSNASIFNLTNTKVETYRIALSKANTQFNATGSVINVTGAFSNASSITLSNGATLNVTTSTVNDGTINVIGNGNTVSASNLSGAGSIVFKNAALDNKVALSGTQGKVRFLGTGSITDPTLDVAAKFYVGSFELAADDAEDSELTISNDVNFNGITYVGADKEAETGKMAMLDIAAGKTLNVSQLYARKSSQISIGTGAKLLSGYGDFQGTISVDGGVAKFTSVGVKHDMSISAENGGVIDLGYTEAQDVGRHHTYSLSDGSILTVSTLYNTDIAISMDTSSNLALAPRAGDVAEGTKLAITIDTSDFTTGLVKVIDMNSHYDYVTKKYTTVGSVTMTVDDYKRIVTGWNDNFIVIDNDLYISDVSVDKVYVNSKWAGSAAGAVVGEGKYYGINAFDNFKSALAVAQGKGAGSSTTISFDDMGYTYAAPLDDDADMASITTPGTYILTDGNGALINYEVEIKSKQATGAENAFEFTIDDAFITLTKLTARDNTVVTISDSRVDFNQFQGGSAYLSAYKNSELYITNSTVGFDPHQSGKATPDELPPAGTTAGSYYNWAPRVVVYGKTRITDSTMFIYVGQADNTGFDVLGNSDTEVKNSTVSLARLNVGDHFLEKYLVPDVDDASDLKATLTVDGSTFINTQYRGDYVSLNGIVVGKANDTAVKGALTVKNKSLVDFTVLTYGDAREVGLQVNNSDSSVVITSGSTVKVPKITNAGTITIDATSLLTGSTYTGAGSSITVDATGFAGGVKKVIDLSQDAALSDVNLINVGETGARLLYGNDGDVFVYNISKETLHVNGEWATGYSVGDEIVLADSTKVYYGINAFSSFVGAMKSVDNSTKTISVDGDVDEPTVALDDGVYSYVTNDLTIKGSGVVTLDLQNSWLAAQGKFVVEEGVTINGLTLYAWTPGTVTVNGTMQSYQLWVFTSTFTINPTADIFLTGGDGMIKMRGNGELNVTGSLADTTNETLADAAQQLHGGYMSIDNTGVRVINLTDTYVSTSWLQNNSTGGSLTVNMDNAALKLQHDRANTLTLTSTAAPSTLNLSNGSRIIAKAATLNKTTADINASSIELSGDVTIDADSVITLEGGHFSAASIDNAGTITIDATSLLTGSTLDNSAGTITIDATDLAANSVQKVIDITGTAGFDASKVEVTGARKIQGADGDVFVTNIDPTFLYFDSSITGKEVGDAVTFTVSGVEKTAYFGINAFNTLDESVFYLSNGTGQTPKTPNVADIYFAAGTDLFNMGKGAIYYYTPASKNVTISMADSSDVSIKTATVEIGNGNSRQSFYLAYAVDLDQVDGQYVLKDKNGTVITIGNRDTLVPTYTIENGVVFGRITGDQIFQVGRIIDPDDIGEKTPSTANIIVGGTINRRVYLAPLSHVTVTNTGKIVEGGECNFIREGSLLEVNGSGKSTDTDEQRAARALQYGANYMAIYGGTVSLNHTKAYSSSQIVMQEHGDNALFKGQAKLILTDTVLTTSYAYLDLGVIDQENIGIAPIFSLNDHSSATFESYIENGGTISIDDTSSLETKTAFTNNGALNITVGGTVTAKSFTNGGMITIELGEFEGTSKEVIHTNNEDPIVPGTITVQRNGEAATDYTYICSAEGNVFVTKVSNDFFVDTEWASLGNGTPVPVTVSGVEKTAFIGTDAFGGIAAVVAKGSGAANGKTIYFQSNDTVGTDAFTHGELDGATLVNGSTTGAANVTVNVGNSTASSMLTGNLTIDEGVTLAASKFIHRNTKEKTTITVEGTFESVTNAYLYAGVMNVAATGKLTGDDVFLNGSGGAYELNVTGNDNKPEQVKVMSLRIGAAATANFTNTSVSAGSLSVTAATGVVKVSNSAINGDVTNAGTIDVVNGTWITGEVINNGTLNARGYTQVTGNVTNNGTVNLDDHSMTTGTFTNSGKLNFDNANTIAATLIHNGATGSINLGDQVDSVTFYADVENAGTLAIDAGKTIVLDPSYSFTNDAAGIVNVAGTLDAAAVENNGTVNVTGKLTSTAAITGAGTIVVTGSGDLDSDVVLSDGGKVVFGTKEAAANTTFSKSITDGDPLPNPANYRHAAVQVMNGNVTIDGTVRIQGDASANRFIVGFRDGVTEEELADINASVTVTGSVTAYNGSWIGAGDAFDETCFDEKFVLTVDGGDFTNNCNGFTVRASGAVYVKKSGTFNISDAAVRGNISVTDSSTMTFGSGNFYGENDHTAQLTIDNSELAVNTKMKLGKEGYSNRMGALVLDNGAQVTGAGEFILYEGGSIRSTASTINIANTITNSGAIALDAASSLTAAGIDNTGTVTIDATGFNSGTKRVIDLDSAVTGNAVTAANLSEGISLLYNADAFDYYLTDGDQSTLYVNSSYTGEFGTEVAEGKYIGINAFSTLTGALAVEPAETIVLESDITENDLTAPLKELTHDLSITGTGSVTWNVTARNAFESDGLAFFVKADGTESAQLTFGEGVNLTVVRNASIGTATYFGYNRDQAITVENNGAIELGSFYVSRGTVYTLTPTGKINVSGYDGQFLVRKHAALNITGTGVEYSLSAPQVYAGFVTLQGGVTTLTDTVLKANSYIQIYNRNVSDDPVNQPSETVEFNVNNSTVSAASFNGIVHASPATEWDYKVHLTNSEMNITGTLSNAGNFIVDASTLVAGSVTNNGTIALDAVSTVTANAITFGENGSINLTIDAKDLTKASYTLIDITGTDALDTTKITVNGEAFADGATYGGYTLALWDNDVMLFQTPVADTTTLYVSESYTGYYGQEVAEGKYFLINAFNNLVDAFDSRKDDTVAVNLDDVSSIASTGNKEWVISQDTTISGNNAATVDLAESNFRFYANDEDAEHIKTLIIDKDVTINLNGTNGNTATFYIGRNSGEFAGMDATIDGTLNVDQFYSSYGSQVTMTGKLATKGALMMHGATNDANASKVIQRNGVVVFDGTGKGYSADDLQVNVKSYLSVFGGDMTFMNTFAKVATTIRLYNHNDIAEGPRSLTLDGANVTAKTLSVEANGKVTLTNGSTLKLTNNASVNDGCSISITDSTLNTVGTLESTGTITVSGTSLLTIGALTGTITVNADADLTGSVVGGTGDIAVSDAATLTLDGTTDVTSFGAVTNAGTIDIEGASVNLGAISNDGTINMDWNDKLTFSGYDGTGLVNINMTGYDVSTASGTVLDYTGVGTKTAADYQVMIGMDAAEFNKYFTVTDNDLCLKGSIVVPSTKYDVAQVQSAVADAKKNGENLTINDATYSYATIGSKFLELDDVNTMVYGGTFDVHVNGGTIVNLEDEDDSGKIGSKTAPLDTNVTINDGEFNKTVTGADRFNCGLSIIRYGNSNLTINGGEFNSVVAGGMLYAQETAGSAKLKGNVNLTINGGNFANFVYGGSFAGKKTMASCTSIDGSVTMSIDATNADISFAKDLVLGSHGYGHIMNGVELKFSGTGTITVTGQIWGSSSGDYYIIKDDGTRKIETSIEGDRLLSFTGFEGNLVCDKIRGFESFAATGSNFDLSDAVSLSDISNWEIGDSTIGGAFTSDFTGDTLTLTSLTSGVIFEDVSKFQLTKTEGDVTTSLFAAVQYKVADNDFVAMNFDGASEWASADNKYRLYLSDNADTGKTEMMFKLA